MVNGKIYVNFGLSLDYEIKDESNTVINPIGEVNNQDAETMVKKGVYPFETAKIYFRTRNISAISEQGDYEPIDQVYTVLGDSPFTNVTVKINNKGLSIGGNYRQFYVEIYKVEITGLKEGYTFIQPYTAKDISSKILSAGAEFSIGQKDSKDIVGDRLYKLDLSYQQQIIPIGTCRDVTTNTSFNDAKFNLANFSNGWYNKVKYLSDNGMLKLGLRLTGGAYEEANGWYTDNSFVGVQIFGGDSSGVGAPALEGVPLSNVFSNGTATELARWFVKFQSDERESLALGDAFNGSFSGVTVGNYFGDNVLIPHTSAQSQSDFDKIYDSLVGNEMYARENIFLINDLNAALKGSTTISTRFWSYLSGKDKYYDAIMAYVPTNFKAHVKNATFGKVFQDENGKEKVGLSLRFSEPVQFKRFANGDTASPYIKAYINGNATNSLKFNYVMGQGTDTLFFEADVSNYKMNITRISFDKAFGFYDVYDFAPSNGTAGATGASQDLNVMEMNNGVETEFISGWDANIHYETYVCSYDLRVPNIPDNNNITQTVKTAHTVTVRPENISETGKLYYAWVEDNSTVPQNLSVDSISPQGYQAISSPSNISGKRYLYLMAVSEFGKKSEPKWYGPFNFDNDKPTLMIETINKTESNFYKQKDFIITIFNKTNSIANFDKFVELKKNLKLFVTSDASGLNVIKEFSIPLKDENLKDEIVTINYSLLANQLDLQLGTDKEYGEYYVFLSISDALENKGKSESISCYFDVREIFSTAFIKNDFEMDEFTAGKLSIGENYHTIDLSKIGDGKEIVFKSNDSSVSYLGIESFVNVKTEVGVISSVNVESTNSEIKISINDKFNPGLYSLTLKDNTVGSNKKSLPIYLYVTNGKDVESGHYQEETAGYQAISNNVVFTNKVFQIPTTTLYYYMTDTGEEVKQSYSVGSRPMVFSSWNTAHSYVLYREYLDLHAVELTQKMATDLNSNSTVSAYHKATGERHEALEGQIWIRYKEVNWRPDTTTSDWVYYYYGADKTSLPINLNAISKELQMALETVASVICSTGKEVNLVTKEDLDQYGAPMLKPEQIHLSRESSAVSITGTPFEKPVEYLGDTGLYLFLDPDAPLATNAFIQFGENRHYYFYDTEKESYQVITQDNRQTFGEYLNKTGKFTILELDENGAREYCVYIDKTAPTLKISWTTKTETATITEYKDFSIDDNGTTISGNNFCIESITDYDVLSFVAIYRYTSQGEGDLLNVYRKSDFANGQLIHLEDGKYHIHVSDRSGNGYIFVLQIKSTPLTFTVREVDNSYIRVEINRDKEEVRYQVFLDGWLFTTNYDDYRFTESGKYTFIIEDIYGNKLTENITFIRKFPIVEWRYQLSDGSYALYNPEENNERISVEKIDDQNYIISTSTYLRFLPLTGCTYEILSGNPNPNKNINTGWVSLNSKTPFTMKVYYELYPETYVIYTCVIDDSAPQISVTYQKEYYELFELEKIQEKLKNGEFNVGDNPFTPQSIGFAIDKDINTENKTKYVTNGERVQRKYFNVQVSDENGVKDVKIYCDGKLIPTDNSDFNNIYVSRRGEYQIIATDNFGNTATFLFVNEYEEKAEYFVDGEKISTDVNFVDYFSGENYNKVEYGKAKAEISILSSAEIHYIITDESGKAYYFAFVVDDGMIYTYQYVVKIVSTENVNPETGETISVVNEIESISVRGAKELVPSVIAKIDEIGVAISLSKTTSGNFLLTVHSTDDVNKTYTVEARVSSLDNQNEMPYYFKTKISNKPSAVEFTDKEGNSITAYKTIKVNKSFKISNNLSSDIVSVEVAFSKTGNYTVYETVYDGTYRQIVFENEGMYHVKVLNVYGIQTDYYIVISSQFAMSATVEYIDGTTIEYSTDYVKVNNNFYSNKSVEFTIYSTNVQVIEKDDSISIIPSEKGYTIIYVNSSGDHYFKIQDEYGNILEKNIYINTAMLVLPENVLTNFNDKALRRDENYTNQMIFINKNIVLESEIAVINMRYGNKTITVYNSLSEVKTIFDESQVIGALGDGEYFITFRDCYGNKTEIVINYRGTSTLTIIRNTLNGIGSEIYSLVEMMKNGVWTNNSVNFLISASKYVLKVDGKDNVTTISYDAKTKNEYSVYYLDEYGFEYTFKVHLHREEVVITPSESTSVSQVSDLLVTKDSVQVLFTKDAVCSYTLNNEEEKIYNAGDSLYKDGIYRFKAVDKAGNVSTYTVKKDSAVEYRLEGSGANEILVNGAVTNSNSVKFFAENNDNVYIKKVFHNNNFIEYDDETFTERGKWELIVADDVGNESYFRFYIIYGKIDGFVYNTPYNYLITSVIWEVEGAIADATETIKEQGIKLEATKNGKYTVTMQSSVTGEVKSFNFTIDITPPQVELVGCNPNEKTINNITLKGCMVGDTVFVYKDGELVKTVRIESNYMDPPTISEAGKYKIIVENEAGVQTELSFERRYIPNFAGSMLIIVLSITIVIGLFVGLIWRNHSKTDD